MNSSDDVHRVTENIYRNLAEQFNPAVRQILTCAKAYHKALVAASTAARSYIESLGRLGHNCKNSGQGGTEEIGEAIFRIAEVQKEIQLKFEDCNKSFFAEVVLPLEQKLDNDFKNASAEQKKYHGGHKSYSVPYTKALEAHKKFQKKNNRSKLAFDDDREIPLKRTLDRCRDKLDEFRLQGLKLALLEERKCYCFILAKLCAVSSTQLYYHDRGMDLLTVELGHWRQLCSQPNILPRSADPLLHILDHNSTNSFAVYMPDSVCHSPYHHSSTRTSSEGQRSGPPSEYALPASPSMSHDTLPRSVAMSMSHPPPGPPPGPPAGRQVRALYGHLADQESQLSFSMGDAITLMGDAADGWQFGHNSRTGQYGWFPLSFTDSYESRHQLQTQTPMRFRQRAKSFSEMNGDARSLSEFSGWSHDHYMPGTTHRPRSLHESSLHNAPSLPQVYSELSYVQISAASGQSGRGLPTVPPRHVAGDHQQEPLPPPPPPATAAAPPPPAPPAPPPPPPPGFQTMHH
ncbi:BAR/IMD domain-containing adapter protein 2-like isoform X2 [Littorina saxatilis]|uniref:BAR/IMD domain-containing adapter protein 2-like isoform X2 n=1 Tax=Littorina saxatilis TaxID=31220 RepID=UPI0038B5BCB1